MTTDHPQRVLDSCGENDIPAVYIADDGVNPDEASWLNQEIIISKGGLQEGFLLPGDNIAHLSDKELFGRRLKRFIQGQKTHHRREDLDVIHAIDELRRGDYVVHTKHGVGQFIELTHIEIEGEYREYLSVQYSGSDKLHVPVDQVNMLSRYRGTGEKPPKLSKMGGVEWSKVKGKVKKSILWPCL